MKWNLAQLARLADFLKAPGHPLLLIAGPDVIEDETSTLKTAEKMKELTDRLELPYIFKVSFDKANRTSLSAYRGPGLKKALPLLKKIKSRFGLALTTDIHTPDQAEAVAEVVDLIQVPAFLCRQTDLVVAAARTGKPVNVKKGQFLAPWDVANIADKIKESGNNQVIFTERGTAFGYNTLVNDMKAIPLIRKLGYPILYDATHSVQAPSALGNRTGGDRTLIPPLARAAVAAGCDGIFLEVHENPDQALCDAANTLALADLPGLMKTLTAIRKLIPG